MILCILISINIKQLESNDVDKNTKTDENDGNEITTDMNVAVKDELEFTNLESEFKYILAKVNSEEVNIFSNFEISSVYMCVFVSESIDFLSYPLHLGFRYLDMLVLISPV